MLTINDIIAELKAKTYASKLIVFGSVARQASDPKDVDVVLDARGCATFQDICRNYKQEMRDLLAIAYHCYGAVDCFVLGDDGLYVRNDLATGWIRSAKQSDLKKAIQADGRPLLEIRKSEI